MPTYTIKCDAYRLSTSTNPTASSIYSDDSDTNYQEFAAVSVMPLEINHNPHSSVMPHPNQQINDPGPQVRQSKLPIFSQVRGLLNKPVPTKTKPWDAGWDEFSGEPSESGKPRLGQVPSKYQSPYDKAFQEPRTKRRPSPPPLNTRISERSMSPVSVLYDDYENEMKPIVPLKAGGRCISPVSPVSISPISTKLPAPLSANTRSQPTQQRQESSVEPSPASKVIKRKPVSRYMPMTENIPPPATSHKRQTSLESQESADTDAMTPPASRGKDPTSHFSWTTYAPSQYRQSTDTYAANQHYGSGPESDPRPQMEPNQSRFSWTTVNTTTTFQGDATFTTQDQPPPIPHQYRMSQVPMQSILSRKRPVQRQEPQEWAPPRSANNSKPPTPVDRLHPDGRFKPPSLHTSRSQSPSSGGGKKLPLPPASPNNMTHLETLQATEKEILLRRRNLERAIASCEKVETASPMEVSFEEVRRTKKRLADLRRALDEILLEERQNGINISRIRRKEGEEEGLWVRRVTG